MKIHLLVPQDYPKASVKWSVHGWQRLSHKMQHCLLFLCLLFSPLDTVIDRSTCILDNVWASASDFVILALFTKQRFQIISSIFPL